MSTMSHSQGSTCVIHSHHSRLQDSTLSLTVGHGGPYRSEKHRQYQTAPPTAKKSEISSSSRRYSPYSTGTRPPTTDQYSHIVCGIHTSANLPPYKSPADDCLPQIQVRRTPNFVMSPEFPTRTLKKFPAPHQRKRNSRKPKLRLFLHKLFAQRHTRIKFICGGS